MKQILKILICTTLIAACGKGKSFEKDVRSLAELRCKEMQLMAKEATDATAQIELRALQQQIKEKMEALQQKYKDNDAETNKKGDAIMEEVMRKCK